MSETRAQYGEAEPISVRAEQRAREMAKTIGMPGVWDLFLSDAYDVEMALAALNHAAPAAQKEGE